MRPGPVSAGARSAVPCSFCPQLTPSISVPFSLLTLTCPSRCGNSHTVASWTSGSTRPHPHTQASPLCACRGVLALGMDGSRAWA